MDNDVVNDSVWLIMINLFVNVNDIDNKIPITSRLITKIQYDFYKQGPGMKTEDVVKKITWWAGQKDWLQRKKKGDRKFKPQRLEIK